MPKGLRTAIIGGGIIGLTTAVTLAKQGHQITIFEQSGFGSGCSIAANGALTPCSDHNTSSATTSLAELGTALYPEHIQWLRHVTGTTVDSGGNGVLEILLRGEEASGFEHFHELENLGYPVTFLDASEVRVLEPEISELTAAAIHYAGETWVDTQRLIAVLTAALPILEVAIRCPAKVESVLVTDNFEIEVSATTGVEPFDAAIICTGYGSCKIQGTRAVRIYRVRGEILEVQAQSDLLSHCLYRGDSFITPRRDGRLLLGTSYVPHLAGMDENPSTVSVSGAFRKLRGALDILPCIENAELTRTWKSWRPTTSDALPVIGTYGARNIILAVGFSGLGITMAPAVAMAISTIMEGGEPVEAVLSLGPDRDGLEFVDD